MGTEVIAEYHEEEAEKERHNGVAASCGFFDVMFDAMLSSDTCSKK